MTSDKNPVEYYNEAVEMLQAMRQELQAKLDEIEGIKTKLVITDTKLQLTQTELKETQVKLKVTEDYIDNTLVGSVTAFAMTTPPEGWLTCNGAAVSRTNYARLFEKIGTTFGEGDGEITFNLPDLRGVFIRGWDTDNRFDLERKFGSYQDDQMQSHIHKDSGHSHSSSVSSNGSHSHSSNVSPKIYEEDSTSLLNKGYGNFYIGEEHFSKQDSGIYGVTLSILKKTGTMLSISEFHYHNIEINSAGYHSHTVSINNSFASLGNPASSDFGEPRHGYETRAKNVALIYCIKY